MFMANCVITICFLFPQRYANVFHTTKCFNVKELLTNKKTPNIPFEVLVANLQIHGVGKYITNLNIYFGINKLFVIFFASLI